MEHHDQERSLAGVQQLSLRSLIIGMLGSCVITASSMYVALRMGALPWPTIFVAVLSMALLKALGKTTLNEINITQTSMSAGAMVAGGLAFTLPGLWITKAWSGNAATPEHFLQVLAIAVAGMLLGTVLTWFLRIRFIERDALPYPIGLAAAETVKAGDAGGKKSRILFGTMAFSAVFTYMRDSLGWIPAAMTSKWLYARNIYCGIWLSPMAVGIGYIIGTLFTGIWFAGAVLSYFVIIPLGPKFGIFSSPAEAVAFKNTAGIGLMVGTGIGILISFITTALRKRSSDSVEETKTEVKAKRSSYLFSIIAGAIAFVLSIITGLSPLASLLLIVGVFGASAMAATITGQTGINPMEIFGIIVLIIIRLVIDVDSIGAFFIAACVAVACGYAGDLLNDYKTGVVLGTNPVAQLISQIVGGLAGTVVATAAMFAIIAQYGGVGPEKGLAAVQAFAVSQMVNGIGSPVVFWSTTAIGALLYILRIPSMTLGIGMYLSFEISSVVFLGGLVRYIADKARPKSNESGNVAASGLLGGEGITGVTVAIVKLLTRG